MFSFISFDVPSTIIQGDVIGLSLSPSLDFELSKEM